MEETAIRITETGWAHWLVFHSAADARVLLTVDRNGTVMMPADLTLEEARSVIEQLAPMAVQKRGQDDG